MAIGLARQDGASVTVLDERGRYLYRKLGELVGFTGTTVSIRTSPGAAAVTTYDERGITLFVR